MEKQKSWQFYLIIAVIVLTLYNIMPTIFYYSKPLKDPITAPRAEVVSNEIVERINGIEVDSKAWLESFCKLLGVKPISIQLKENDHRLFEVAFSSAQEATLFNRFLPKAGALIPFIPAQLELYPASEPTKSLVVRKVGIQLDPAEVNKLFQFAEKYDAQGKISDLYRSIVYDRAVQLGLAFAGPSKQAIQLYAVVQNPTESRLNDITVALAREIVDIENTFGANSPIAKRFYASFSQIEVPDVDGMIQKFISKAETLKSQIDAQKAAIVQEQKKLKEQNALLDSSKQQLLGLLDNQRNALESAVAIIKKRIGDFKAGKKPLTEQAITAALSQDAAKAGVTDPVQVLSLEGRNPFIQALTIDWSNDKIATKFYDDVQAIRLKEGNTEAVAFSKEKLNQYAINEIARSGSIADEIIIPDGDNFAIQLDNLSNTRSLLTFNLGYLAEKQSQQINNQLFLGWVPQHTDLVRDAYPIRTYQDFKKMKPEDQKLGLIIYAPAQYQEAPPAGFRTGSIYVIARGLDAILQKYRATPDAPDSKVLVADINQLTSLLRQYGFIDYSAAAYGFGPEYSKDYIFELDDYYTNLLAASRENFSVKGSKRYAVLDFTDVEQRILARNKIEDRIQEDLLKWKEEYNAAQVDLNVASKYLVPHPTKNVFWENFKISFAKYFRGDDRKVLKWGLDLSGGKTVRIGLRDHNNRPVTNPDDINTAVNELYTRINKMGVSERTIRVEGNNILLDFPGSQGLSASELVKASAMYFHIVNEKFTANNPTLREPINQFLQEVWNEAVVTNRKDVQSINEIAWQHLGADLASGANTRPLSDAAKMLYDNGLRLANPKDSSMSHAYNDTLSSVAVLRDGEMAEMDGQTYPLLIVFHNYALEGSNLTNITAGYDPMRGNVLNFEVKKSYEGADKSNGSPRDDLYAWTSQFSQDKILGTPKEAYSQGHGWRMAVILNDSIITQPTLHAALTDGGNISGRFSQREINQLAADLKAGSLSFSPRILSEQNVSPELGQEERSKGIVASLVALALVVISMVGYYHFAGVVASCAVLFNILIMWGVLQNLDAALTLPGIAGIVLTIGMAVDANVLVFERIREEFKISGRIASAIQAGYRKAFSAIVDSNITTIIAAVILIQFDSGPIKGFAVTLIIGIISSMFTALFMTRYFFAGWVQNPNNKTLSMAQFFTTTHFDFLAMTKKAVIISVIAMILGGYLFIEERKTIFGMDFTGGYSLNVELATKEGNPDYRNEATSALLAQGASSSDVQIRELSKPNLLRIQLGMGFEEKDHPFYQMPQEMNDGKFAFEWQHNPRIVWVVDALAKAGLQVQSTQLDSLSRDWTVMSGQFSDAMRWNAITGLAIALLCILIYITFRFEFKFAVGAVVGLVHDLIITVGILALFHKMGFAVQIDLQVIGALMTIIGYSLNDTIIVFDRIREEIKILRKLPFHEVVNHALNVTLSRTVMTSGTTLLVLLTLVLLGGKSIFSFSLVMTIGVMVGTLSSLFIASPVMIYFHDKEEEEQKALHAN